VFLDVGGQVRVVALEQRGSVSLQCVLHAHCPVTVVHADPQPEEPRPHQTVEEVRAQTTAPFI